MSLCFVDPADAIRAIADSVGREARRQLLGEAVRAWVDEIPEAELEVHYAKAISELDEHDLSMLAAWHASMEVGVPIPNRDYLMGAFPSLGVHRREAQRPVLPVFDPGGAPPLEQDPLRQRGSLDVQVAASLGGTQI